MNLFALLKAVNTVRNKELYKFTVLLSEASEAESSENITMYIGLCVAIAVFLIVIVIIVIVVRRRNNHQRAMRDRDPLSNGGKNISSLLQNIFKCILENGFAEKKIICIKT